MSRRGNWDRLRIRDRMRRYGTSDARDELRAVNAMLDSSTRGPRRLRPPPKAVLSSQAAAAFIAWREKQAAAPPAPAASDITPPWE